jgi:hypothetical protein
MFFFLSGCEWRKKKTLAYGVPKKSKTARKHPTHTHTPMLEGDNGVGMDAGNESGSDGYLRQCMQQCEASYRGIQYGKLICINCGNYRVHNVGECVLRNLEPPRHFCIVCQQSLTAFMRNHALSAPHLTVYTPPELHECTASTIVDGVCRVPHVFRYRAHPRATADVRNAMRKFNALVCDGTSDHLRLTGATRAREMQQPSVDSVRVFWLLEQAAPAHDALQRLMPASQAPHAQAPRDSNGQVEESGACASPVEIAHAPSAPPTPTPPPPPPPPKPVRFLDALRLQPPNEFETCRAEDRCRGCAGLVCPPHEFYLRYGLHFAESATDRAFCASCRTPVRTGLTVAEKHEATALLFAVTNQHVYTTRAVLRGGGGGGGNNTDEDDASNGTSVFADSIRQRVKYGDVEPRAEDDANNSGGGGGGGGGVGGGASTAAVTTSFVRNAMRVLQVSYVSARTWLARVCAEEHAREVREQAERAAIELEAPDELCQPPPVRR